MAHFFIFEGRIGSPILSIREMKTMIPKGGDKRQVSPRPKIIFMLDGECGVRMKNGITAELRRGDILFVPKPCHHYYTSLYPDRDAEIYTFVINFCLPDLARKKTTPTDKEWHRLLTRLPTSDLHLPNGMDSKMQTWIDQFREAFYASDRPGSLLEMQAIVSQLMVHLGRHFSDGTLISHGPPARRSQSFIVGEVREYLTKTLERKHTLPEVAWRFSLSEEHLARIFKKEAGISVMTHLRKIRVEAAKVFLLSSNQTVVAIAARAGFTSSNQFCRVFSQLTGQSPMEYRRAHAGLHDPFISKSILLPLPAQSFTRR